jgi:hypothetical protein
VLQSFHPLLNTINPRVAAKTYMDWPYAGKNSDHYAEFSTTSLFDLAAI